MLRFMGFFFVLFCFGFVFFLVFQDRISLYSPGCSGTHSVDQTGLELRNSPASASQVLGLKVCATTPGYDLCFLYHVHINFLLTIFQSFNFNAWHCSVMVVIFIVQCINPTDVHILSCLFSFHFEDLSFAHPLWQVLPALVCWGISLYVFLFKINTF